MTSILEIKCPTCKDSDCVESVRHDNCTACGWAQFTPLDQLVPEACSCAPEMPCMGCVGNVCKPADSVKCEICGHTGPKIHPGQQPHSCVGRLVDSDQAVEEKIKQILDAEREWLRERLKYRLWELVGLARGSK